MGGEDADHLGVDGVPDPVDESQSDGVVSVEQPHPTNWLADLWDNHHRFVAVSFILLVGAPVLAGLSAAILEETLRLPGDAQGFLESGVLTYFPAVFLCLYLARRAVEREYRTLRSFAERDLIIFNHEDAEHASSGTPMNSSQLRKDEFEKLIRFYRWLLAAITLRQTPDDGPLLPNHHDLYQRFKYAAVLVWILGGIALAVTTYNHWFSVDVYGFDTWYSAAHPLGFAVRTAFNTVLFLGIGPLLVVQFGVLSFLLYHPFRFLGARNALRYRRFAPDGVGGYSTFGYQSLTNVLVILPLSIIGVVFLAFLPLTRLLILGGIVYILSFPVLFFGPLLKARAEIRKANERELNVIATAYAENYEDYKRELTEVETVSEIDDQHLLTRHQALRQADDVFKEVRDRPNWPFDRGVLQRFVSLMATLISGFMLSIL